MTYYNRKEQLEFTLKSIFQSVQNDYEIIIVDDGSIKSERIEYLQDVYSFIKIIRIEKENKWWNNPCIPFNMGIAKAKGDIIVLQNSECIHVGDVLDYIVHNLNEENYLTMSAYSLNSEMSVLIRVLKYEFIYTFSNKLPQKIYESKDGLGWYNHPVYCPVYYHFCSAITKTNMDKLQGFDERYAKGIAFDDNELVERITRLGLKKEIVTGVFVNHQWHDKVDHFSAEKYHEKHDRNRRLFKYITKNEIEIGKINSYV